MFNETSSYFITYNLQVDNEFNIGILKIKFKRPTIDYITGYINS